MYRCFHASINTFNIYESISENNREACYEVEDNKKASMAEGGRSSVGGSWEVESKGRIMRSSGSCKHLCFPVTETKTNIWRNSRI